MKRPPRSLARVWFENLASVRITLALIGLSMILVLVGTLAQVEIGTFAAQKAYFNSFWIYGRWPLGVRIPIFPGGLIIGFFWLLNLTAAFFVRFQWRNAGVFVTHLGLMLLMVGQFLTQTFAQETQLPLELGQTANYSESPRETELAIMDLSGGPTQKVISIPDSRLSRGGEISIPGSAFSVNVRQFYPNAAIQMASGGAAPAATQGIGARISAERLPPVSSDDETNNVAAVVEIISDGKSLGTWLVSAGLGAPQSFFSSGREYRLSIRPRRKYYHFSLTLKEFHHDIYPGTDIPRNFSSLVHLADPLTHESRDALISMNNPLRFQGNTFYQASFGKEDRLSVFQVVENPAWATPYLSCLLVTLGLAIQFLSHLFEFKRSAA